ncbi:hypothetical protein HPP92_015056 [Vanilla planifolia]|uniref:Uncharacterized protein n=1 Tax=Vanilla planifolia TaxID=51239 RepID=A0A835URP0_VANPL|nr:hypothetical protein HPP92_015056 [Vanilla planifolia]
MPRPRVCRGRASRPGGFAAVSPLVESVDEPATGAGLARRLTRSGWRRLGADGATGGGGRERGGKKFFALFGSSNLKYLILCKIPFSLYTLMENLTKIAIALDHPFDSSRIPIGAS